jgi:hypothetical protein
LTSLSPPSSRPAFCAPRLSRSRTRHYSLSFIRSLYSCCSLQLFVTTMPIFHDPHDSPPTSSFLPQASVTGFQRADTSGFAVERSLESDMQSEPPKIDISLDRDPESPSQTRKPFMFGRKEWIERIKRTNSPSWLQRQGVSTRRPREHLQGVC